MMLVRFRPSNQYTRKTNTAHLVDRMGGNYVSLCGIERNMTATIRHDHETKVCQKCDRIDSVSHLSSYDGRRQASAR